MRCGIDDLRMELFDTLQRLKSANDPNCSKNEKCSVEEAEAVCAIAKEITETYKVQLTALNILAKADNPSRAQLMLESAGMMRSEKICE